MMGDLPIFAATAAKAIEVHQKEARKPYWYLRLEGIACLVHKVLRTLYHLAYPTGRSATPRTLSGVLGKSRAGRVGRSKRDFRFPPRNRLLLTRPR
jgi:hypothetical protein